MEFSTVITIVVYALMCRLTIGSLALMLTKSLLNEDFKYNLRWLNKYIIRKSAYKMIMTLCYVIVINVVRSLNYPVLQSLWLVGMLILIEVTVFIYYELPSYGYSEIKRGLGHYRWFIV